MQHRTTSWLTAIAAVTFCVFGGGAAHGQTSSGQYVQTIQKAPTATELHMPKGILPQQNVTLKALVHTGISTTSIAAPTPNITFVVDGANLPSSATLSSEQATNLLNYSEAFNSWTNNGTTVAAPSVQGPFGTVQNASTTGGEWGTTATAVTFPAGSSTSLTQTVGVSGTPVSYAGQQVVFSVWAQASAASSLTLTISDGSGGTTTNKTINVGTSWRRYYVSVTLPGGAANGLKATIASAGTAAQTVNLFGAQAEANGLEASYPGVYVQTNNNAPLLGTGAVATLTYQYATAGDHTTSVSYPGDSNYLGSVSNTLNTQAQDATATITLASSLNPSVYGQNVSFTATLTGDGTPWTAGGVITISAGGTTLGTCNVTANATTNQTCSTTATNALPTGTDTITATYTADSNYSNASTTLAQVVQLASAVVTMTGTPQPSIYGQNVNFTVAVAGVSGLAIPSGTVTVIDNGSCASACTGGTTLSTGALTNGVYTFSNALLTGGAHNIVINYSGDGSYAASPVTQ